MTAVHDLHCWSLSSDVRALSAHLVLDGHPSLEEAQVVGERVKTSVRDRFHVAHATLEMDASPAPRTSQTPAQSTRSTAPSTRGHHGCQTTPALLTRVRR